MRKINLVVLFLFAFRSETLFSALSRPLFLGVQENQRNRIWLICAYPGHLGPSKTLASIATSLRHLLPPESLDYHYFLEDEMSILQSKVAIIQLSATYHQFIHPHKLRGSHGLIVDCRIPTLSRALLSIEGEVGVAAVGRTDAPLTRNHESVVSAAL